MKRFISLFLVIVMVVACLTACPESTPDEGEAIDAYISEQFANAIAECERKYPSGSSAGATEDSFVLADGETYDGSAVEIEFSHTMGQSLRDVLDAYIVEFNKIYPNIKITHTQVGGYDDVRDTVSKQILAGTQPNIAYCYPDHVALYNLANAVVTLDQFINSPELGLTQEQIDDFIPAYYEEGRSYGDGKMYTLPLSKSTEVLYYNKTFFDNNGLSVPTTWDEMEALCQRILEIDTTPQNIPLGYDSESNWFITMCEQYGSPYTSATGTKYLFNNETNRNFVKRFAEWYYNGYVTTQEIFGAYTSGLFIETDTSKAHSYMCIGSSAGASHQIPTGENAFEVGIAPIPQVDPSKPKAISQGPSLVILNNDNRQEVIASWLFVKFLTTNIEFQAEFSIASGYIPVLQSVMENEIYKSEFIDKADGWKNLTALAVKVGLEQKDSYYVSPAFTGSSVARDEVGKIIQNVLVNYGSHLN